MYVHIPKSSKIRICPRLPKLPKGSKKTLAANFRHFPNSHNQHSQCTSPNLAPLRGFCSWSYVACFPLPKPTYGRSRGVADFQNLPQQISKLKSAIFLLGNPSNIVFLVTSYFTRIFWVSPVFWGSFQSWCF